MEIDIRDCIHVFAPASIGAECRTKKVNFFEKSSQLLMHYHRAPWPNVEEIQHDVIVKYSIIYFLCPWLIRTPGNDMRGPETVG